MLVLILDFGTMQRCGVKDRRQAISTSDESSVDVDFKGEGRENLMSPILRVGRHVPLVASLALPLSLAPLAPLLPALGQTDGE